MDKKITVRLRLFFAILSLTPSLICINSAYNSYKRSQTQLTKDLGYQVQVCGAWDCQYFSKSLINSDKSRQMGFLWQYEGGENNAYKNYLTIAQDSLNQEKNSAIFFSILGLFAAIPTILAITLNKLVLENNTIKVYSFGLLKSSIQVKDIKEIHIETGTPFSENKTKIQEMNWRDTVFITDGKQTIFIKLSLYPDFRKIVNTVVQKVEPEITFSKKTVGQVLKESI